MEVKQRNTVPPVGLLGASVLFWGFIAEYLFVSIAAAIALESHRLLRTRWNFQEKHFISAWNLSLILLFATIIIPLINDPKSAVLDEQFIWSPITFLPLILAQLFSETGRLPLRTFFISQQWQAKKRIKEGKQPKPSSQVSIYYVYCLMTIMTAGLIEDAGRLFFIGGICFIILILLSLSGRSVSYPVLIAGWIFVAVVSFASQLGVREIHMQFVRMSKAWFDSWHPIDPIKAHTQIGRVGEAKLSSRIIWRVKPISGAQPRLIQEASYNTYHKTAWFNERDTEFVTHTEERDSKGILHRLVRGLDAEPSARIQISGLPNQNNIYLPLPLDTVSLRNLDALVQSHVTGIVKANNFPPILRFEAEVVEDAQFIAPPNLERDLAVPEIEEPALDEIVDALQLESDRPREALQKLSRFFEEQFRYTTYLTIKQSNWSRSETPISQFLLEVREGHCEYFAASTALILRRAGIPARYVIGYAVQEYNPDKQLYYVRGLHGHAWAQAWIGDKWVNVDNTPPSWHDIEQKQVPPFQNIYDWFNSIYHGYQAFRLDGLSEGFRQNLVIFIIIALVIYVPVRILTSGAKRKRKQALDAADAVEKWGLDSALFDLEPLLAESGLPREASETWSTWWKRSFHQLPAKFNQEFEQILGYHYRLRYCSAGISQQETQVLKQAVSNCNASIAELKRNMKI